VGYRVLATDQHHASVDVERGILASIGAEVVNGMCTSQDEVVALGTDFHALLVSYTPIGETVFSQLKNLVVVTKYGVGYDNIDTEAATRAGVMVCNVRSHCTEEVSTHTLGLVLGLARHIAQFDAGIRAHVWCEDPAPLGIRRLAGRSLGIVGLGRIGRRTAEKATAFGLAIVVYDPYLTDEEIASKGYARETDLAALFRRCDIVSLHCPLTSETRGMIDASILAAAGGLILINTARGGVVDHEALAEAMARNLRLRYGADVFVEEPPYSGRPSLEYLLHSERTLFTPHAGWYSHESAQELVTEAARQILAALKGEQPSNVVNPKVLASRRRL
jgi:D-3-phosphoglycerate dehydrogenase / 2-oxoglutarate reductase